MFLSRSSTAVRGLLVVALVCLTIGYAAADSLVYQGEAPVGSGYPNEGISSYTGSNASGTLWDYVYDISGWTTGPSSVQQWGIEVLTPIASGKIWSPAEWTATYYPVVPSDMGGFDTLWGKMAVIWVAGINAQVAEGFHFQSGLPPVKLAYDSDRSAFLGDEWSASIPEPSTLLLASALLLSAGIARRRRKHAKS